MSNNTEKKPTIADNTVVIETNIGNIIYEIPNGNLALQYEMEKFAEQLKKLY